jgi:hypothetical protein
LPFSGACRERAAWIQGHRRHATAMSPQHRSDAIDEPHLVLTGKEGGDPHVLERRLAHHMVRTELGLRATQHSSAKLWWVVLHRAAAKLLPVISSPCARARSSVIQLRSRRCAVLSGWFDELAPKWRCLRVGAPSAKTFGKTPAVLDIVVALRWLLGAIGEASLGGEPWSEPSIVGDRRCRARLALAA